MADDITVVPARGEDAAAIVTLVTELAIEVDGPDAADPIVIERNVRELFRDPVTRFLVARDDGRVVGFVSYTTRKTILHPTESALIDELVVSRTHRERGVGRALVSEVAERCRAMGCCELEVSTLKGNRKARDFYRKCGFEEDAVLLEMDL